MTGWSGGKATAWLGASAGVGPWAQRMITVSVSHITGHTCAHARTHTILSSGQRCVLSAPGLCLTHCHRVNPSLLLLGGGHEGRSLHEKREQHHHYDASAEQQHLLQGAPVGRGVGLRAGHWLRKGWGPETLHTHSPPPPLPYRGPVSDGGEGHSPRVIFLQEVRQHVHQGDVEKATRGEGQDPGHGLLCGGRSPDWLGAQGGPVHHTHSHWVDCGQLLACTRGRGSCALWPGPLH